MAVFMLHEWNLLSPPPPDQGVVLTVNDFLVKAAALTMEVSSLCYANVCFLLPWGLHSCDTPNVLHGS